MLNLLSVNFRRAFLRKRFIIGGGFPCAIGLLIVYLAYRTDGNVDYAPFFMTGFLPMLIGITAGLYISQDYTTNTIRNKIINGHSRTSIYLSNFITSMVGTFIIYGVYLLLTFGLGSLVTGVSSDFDGERTFKGILLVFCILFTFTSITVMLCMINSGVSGTVISTLMYMILGMSSLIIVFVDNDLFKELFVNLNPTFQIDTVSEYATGAEYSEENIHISWIPISSIAYIILTTVIGISVFNKKDIK